MNPGARAPAPPRWQRGERVTDPDGSRWIVTRVACESGQWGYTRVRAGSLAAQMIVPSLQDPASSSRKARGPLNGQ